MDKENAGDLIAKGIELTKSGNHEELFQDILTRDGLSIPCKKSKSPLA